MLKTTLIALACSATAAMAALVYAGRTVHSSPFQMDIPYGSGLKVTPDPANIWSWHHTFAAGATVDVLVDVDGNQVMDTEHAWLRVMSLVQGSRLAPPVRKGAEHHLPPQPSPRRCSVASI